MEVNRQYVVKYIKYNFNYKLDSGNFFATQTISSIKGKILL